MDLALLDVNLPGMDGLECLRALRELQPELPALLFSGAPLDDDRERAASTLRAGFLQKPVRLRALLEAVEALLAPGLHQRM